MLLALTFVLCLGAQVLLVAALACLFVKYAIHQPTTMTDLLYVLASIGFFALMIAFIWACEKV